MAQDAALVDDVGAVSSERLAGTRKRGKAAKGGIRVRFAAGAEARLDPESPRDRVWAEVLNSLRQTRQPAYVEINPDTRFITSLLLPRDFLVTAIRESPGQDGLEVELEISHARHLLRRDHPRFDELRRALERARREKARVLVTNALDGPTIVDVRPAADARRSK